MRHKSLKQIPTSLRRGQLKDLVNNGDGTRVKEIVSTHDRIMQGTSDEGATSYLTSGPYEPPGTSIRNAVDQERWGKHVC